MQIERFFGETIEPIPGASPDETGKAVSGRGRVMLYKTHTAGAGRGYHPTGIVMEVENPSVSNVNHPGWVEMERVDGKLVIKAAEVTPDHSA